MFRNNTDLNGQDLGAFFVAKRREFSRVWSIGRTFNMQSFRFADAGVEFAHLWR